MAKFWKSFALALVLLLSIAVFAQTHTAGMLDIPNTWTAPQNFVGGFLGSLDGCTGHSGSFACPMAITAGTTLQTEDISQATTNPTMQTPYGGSGYISQNYLGTHWSLPLNATTGVNNTLQTIDSYALAGGFNFNEDGYTNKSNWTNLYSHVWAYTPGQHMGVNSVLNHYSSGDAIGMSTNVTHYGQTINGSDEGAEAYGAAVSQGGIAYQGTIASGAGTGSTSVAVTPTQGSGTQGEGRTLIDLTQGFGAGVITSITGSGPTVFTGSGTSWPVSTETTLSAAIHVTSPATAPGSVTATVGSTAGMTTSSLVCVADAGSFEAVYPSAVNSGTTFTATFRKAHASGAFVAWGGLCGSYIAMTKDIWTTAGGFGYTNVTPPLRQIWPVIGSPSATTADVWITAAAVWDSYQGQARTASEAYTLYPGAETIAVASSGTVDNTFILAPNNVAWASSDSVEQSLGASLKVSYANTQITRFFPAQGNGGGGTGTTYNGIWTGADTLMYWRNNTNPATYVSGGGALTPPSALRVFGVSNVGLQFDYAPDSALFSIGCPNIGCAVNQNSTVFQLKNNSIGGGYDYIQYDPATASWQFTQGGYAQQFTFPNTTVAPTGGTLLVSGSTPTLSGANTFTGNNTHTGTEFFDGAVVVGGTNSGHGVNGVIDIESSTGAVMASFYGGQPYPLVIPGILYGAYGSGLYTTLTPSATSNIAVSLPAASGTLALTSQLPIPASLTTTSATSDNVTVTGMTSSGHCSLTATNASAATNLTTTYVSSKTTNQITVTHTATSGLTYDVICTPN